MYNNQRIMKDEESPMRKTVAESGAYQLDWLCFRAFCIKIVL